MKGEVTLRILETIRDFAGDQVDLMEAFFTAGYGASLGKIDYEFRKIKKDRQQNLISREQRRRYSNLVSRLKRDGLIKDDSAALTDKGLRKLNELRDRRAGKLPDVLAYAKEDGNRNVIVIFDIPEKDKRKREWLRSALKVLGLKLVQKSVWIGKTKIPKDFLDDLAGLKLVGYVEIFEISKTGSLDPLIKNN